MQDKNYWNNDEKIKYYETLFGSKYAAIMFIAKYARYLAESNDNIISHASALNWAVTGIKPRFRKRNKYENVKISYAMDMLNYVSNEDIRKSVKDSIHASLQEFHLIYIYTETLNESQKGKVRVLCNMIWDIITGGIDGYIGQNL